MKFRMAVPLCRRLEDSDTDTAAKAGSAKSKTLTYITVLTILCALVAALGVAPATAGETVLHSFNPYPRGGKPFAKLCLGPDGKFYGTASNGGVAGAGVVFKVDKKGHETVLYNFTGGADGGSPYAAVICNSEDSIYGTTSVGGADGAGVVFRVDGAGHETVLYSFTGGADGGYPDAGLIQDWAGNFYGTTNGGGVAGAGVVFKLDRKGHETVLYSFTGGNDGAYPSAGVVLDWAGNLYGMTCCGGAADAGVVFKLDTKGHETVLYNFTGGNDGGYPFGLEQGVILDWAGNLYGTTSYGGVAGAGVVFKVDTKGHETVLYNFTGGAEGGYPFAGLVLDWAGNLYGTTNSGGAASAGVVFKVDTKGHETVLYSFTGGADGGYPGAGVIQDWEGNLYGTTGNGGHGDAGVVFKLDSKGKESVLYSFPGMSDGTKPWAGVVQDSAGNLYGTTSYGGSAGAGVVFKLDTNGHETLLYNFTGGNDGANPFAGVTLDWAGNLYGTTPFGGAADAGVVYKLDATGHETVLYSFTGGADGRYPFYASLVLDSAGSLYGTTCCGGAADAGVIYKLDATGHETVLYSFTGGADGSHPESALTFDSAGNLYGTTVGGGAAGAGVVWKLDPTGHETVLHNFTGGADGSRPYGGVTFDSVGNLYGTTSSGGPASAGVVWKLDPTGHESVLYTFTGGADGGTLYAGVILDSAGNLYGTTYLGGVVWGVVWKLDPTGHESVLHTFTLADGGYPGAGVIMDSAGNLYGTTSYGGAAGWGTVYKVAPGGPSPAPTQPVHLSFDGSGFGPDHPMPGEPPRRRTQ